MSKKNLVLVVDDEEDICTYLSTMLEDIGYDVIIAKDGKTALEIAKKQNPDLITLDISMPEHTGIKAYREMKSDEQLKKIPVCVITGVDNVNIYFKKLAGFPIPEAYFSKPVDLNELRKTIEELVPTR
ncbi:MAG: response regulator [Desulfovibrio sp.]|jgi:CheY-like chemotaxis protein|nr:response regulator [Desulfovibrio sp.]